MSQERADLALERIFGSEDPRAAPVTRELVPVGLEDAELLKRAFRHRNGHEIRALYEGDTSSYASHSEADLALATHLAWLTGRDPERMDRLIRSSGLMRPKWERADYRERTIERAIAGTTDVYAGPRPRPASAMVRVAEGSEETEKEDSGTYPPLALETFLASPPAEPDWDWRGYHARADLELDTGDPGIGKSLNTLARAVIAATGGGEHLGEPVAARRVVFFDLESPEDVVYARLWGLGLRGDLETFAYVHRPPGFNLLDAASFARFRETLFRHRAELCFVDSLRRAAPGLDENDSRAVSLLFTALREIAAELRVTIVVVHHPRKPVGDARVEALYAARGSGDLIGSVDSYLFYRKLAGGLVRLEHGKARRGREHEPVHFRIVEDDESGAPRIEEVTIESGPSEGQLEEAVVAFVSEHPGASTKQVEDRVTGSRAGIRNALERLSTPGESQSIAAGPGRHPRGKYWFPLNHAGLDSPGELQATLGDISPGLSQGRESPESPAPRRGGESRGDSMDSGEFLEGFEELSGQKSGQPASRVSEKNASQSDTPRGSRSWA